MKNIFFILIPLILSIGIAPVISFADNDIPQWIKTNERWVTQGKITEQEYMTALQYLIDVESFKNSQSKLKVTEKDNKEKNLKSYLDAFTKRNRAPTEGEIANYYVVSMFGGPIKETVSIYTFHDIDFNYDKNQQSGLDNPVSGLLVALKSTPGKDKQKLYDAIAQVDRIDSAKTRPIDLKVDTFSKDGSSIHSVFLKKCRFNDYQIFVQNSFSFDTEFKLPIVEDKLILVCNGISFKSGSQTTSESKIKMKAPFEVKRQQSDLVSNFDVHFEHNGITKSSESFARFFSGYDDSKTTFALESMTSNEKSWYYNAVGFYSKYDAYPGKIRVSVDIKSDDGAVLQTWNYIKCKPSEVEVILEEDRDIVDRVIFECAGVDITSGESFVKNRVGYTFDTLTEDEIAKTFRLHFSGGNLDKKTTYENLLRFSTFEYVPANSGATVFGFWIDALSSEKMLPMYKGLEYYFSSPAAQALIDVEVELLTETRGSTFTPIFKHCKIILIDPQMEIVNGERRLVDRIAFGCTDFVTKYYDSR